MFLDKDERVYRSRNFYICDVPLLEFWIEHPTETFRLVQEIFCLRLNCGLYMIHRYMQVMESLYDEKHFSALIQESFD